MNGEFKSGVTLFLPDKRAFAATIISKFIFYPKIFVFFELRTFNYVKKLFKYINELCEFGKFMIWPPR